jgi:hypothetical protein
MIEAELYDPVMCCLRGAFAAVGKTVQFEIAATVGLSEQARRAIPKGNDIIFAFLSRHRPDIVGVIEGDVFLSPVNRGG